MLSKGKSTRGVKSHHMNHFTRLVTKHLEEKGFIKEKDLIESDKSWLRKYFEFENAKLTLSKTRAAELIKSLYNQENRPALIKGSYGEYRLTEEPLEAYKLRNGIKCMRMVSRYLSIEKQDIVNEWLEEALEEYEEYLEVEEVVIK